MKQKSKKQVEREVLVNYEMMLFILPTFFSAFVFQNLHKYSEIIVTTLLLLAKDNLLDMPLRESHE